MAAAVMCLTAATFLAVAVALLTVHLLARTRLPPRTALGYRPGKHRGGSNGEIFSDRRVYPMEGATATGCSGSEV